MKKYTRTSGKCIEIKEDQIVAREKVWNPYTGRYNTRLWLTTRQYVDVRDVG